MTLRTKVAPHRLLAIIQVAREACADSNWSALEPVLAARWDELRDDDTPPWEVVAEEIEQACHRERVGS